MGGSESALDPTFSRWRQHDQKVLRCRHHPLYFSLCALPGPLPYSLPKGEGVLRFRSCRGRYTLRKVSGFDDGDLRRIDVTPHCRRYLFRR